METWLQQTDRTAESFQKSLFSGINDNDCRRQPNERGLRQQKTENVLLEELKEPGFANLETELVIDRLCQRGKKPRGLSQQPHKAALVNKTSFLAGSARAKGFKD